MPTKRRGLIMPALYRSSNSFAMRKCLVVAVLASASVVCACSKGDSSQTGDIGEKLYDISFRKACYKAFDANGDGFLSADEASAAERIEISGTSYSMLAGYWEPGGFIECIPYAIEGLQYFPNLKYFGYYSNGIESIDLSGNSLLTELHLQSEDLKKLVFPSPCSLKKMALFLYGLKALTVPASVVELENVQCLELSELRFAEPSSLKVVGKECFHGCKQLKELVFPEGLEEVGYYAAGGLDGLELVSLPSTVKSLGTNAFANCKSLRRLEIRAITPPSIDRSFEEGSCANRYSIFVPAQSLDVYKTAWPEYASRIHSLSN